MQDMWPSQGTKRTLQWSSGEHRRRKSGSATSQIFSVTGTTSRRLQMRAMGAAFKMASGLSWSARSSALIEQTTIFVCTQAVFLVVEKHAEKAHNIFQQHLGFVPMSTSLSNCEGMRAHGPLHCRDFRPCIGALFPHLGTPFQSR